MLKYVYCNMCYLYTSRAAIDEYHVQRYYRVLTVDTIVVLCLDIVAAWSI